MTIRASRRAGMASVMAMALILAGCDSLPSLEIFKPGRAAPGANKTAAACVVLDTDMASDDARAVAAMIPTDRVAAIITTGGVSRAENGASAAAHLVSTSRKNIKILVGKNSPTPTNPEWLARSRESAERLGYLLATTVPLDPPETFLNQEIDKALRRCESVDVLITAPWTTFAVYGPGIGKRLRRVVTQGVPPKQGQAPGFNCSYDQAACDRVLGDEDLAAKIEWVALPANADASFVPGPAMAQGLATTGLPGTTAVMMQINPAAVSDGYIWDDTAALYWLYPDLFHKVGDHYEPEVPAAQLEENWRTAVNEAIERQK